MKEPSSKKPYLDKVTETFNEELEVKGGKPLYEMTPEEAREFLLDLQNKYHQSIEADLQDVEIFSEIAGTISLRLVRPEKHKDEKLPLIIYSHGGGWVLGDADAFDMTIKTIANHTKSVVAFVNYSRSPESQYPTAINQIYGALKYLSENPDEYNIDSDHIALVGDSAGGNMAAAVAVKSCKEGGPELKCLVLIYPVTDAEMKTESYDLFKDGPWLTKKAMEWFWDAYIPDKHKRKEIYASPLKADIEDLENLPPALIITDENDVLRDEGEAFARKLIEANVETVCVRINNIHHDFLLLNGLRESRATKTAYKVICKFLKHHLYNENFKR